MTNAVQTLPPRLVRAIIVRQVDATQWRVEGYENLAGRWLFTWVLMPTAGEDRARRYAEKLAQHTGLPVGEKRTGARITLIAGVLGTAARRSA